MTLKEIVKLPNPAKFSHAIAGVLYYKIEAEDKEILFPIDMNNKEDVGTTTFLAEYKPLTLMRYIRKAIDNESLICMPKKKMSFKNTLVSYLIALCIELGYVEVDPKVVRNKEIVTNGQVIERRVPACQKDDAVEYLELCFPDIEDTLTNEITTNI